MSVGGEHLDAPVFFDLSGRRWRRVCVVLGVAGVLAAALLYHALPLAWRHDTVPAYTAKQADGVEYRQVKDPSASLEPSAVVAAAGHTNTPVIGKGPLVRMLHVQKAADGSYASVMYADQPARHRRPGVEAARVLVGDPRDDGEAEVRQPQQQQRPGEHEVAAGRLPKEPP